MLSCQASVRCTPGIFSKTGRKTPSPTLSSDGMRFTQVASHSSHASSPAEAASNSVRRVCTERYSPTGQMAFSIRMTLVTIAVGFAYFGKNARGTAASISATRLGIAGIVHRLRIPADAEVSHPGVVPAGGRTRPMRRPFHLLLRPTQKRRNSRSSASE